MSTVPFLSLEHPIAFAHRGSRVLWPENTMAAFQGAVDFGYRYAETDVHSTRDGIVVVFHDHTLERLTDGHGPVGDRTWRELQELDAGYYFRPEEEYPWRGKGLRIPRLEDVLEAFPDLQLNLDVKHDDVVDPLAELVRRRGVWERVLVGAFADPRIWRFRRLTAGRVATSAGPLEVLATWLPSRAGWSVATPAVALQIPERQGRARLVDRRLIDAAHRRGRQVHVWTVNDPADMRRLLDWGVDGIITDRPDLLKSVLAERGER